MSLQTYNRLIKYDERVVSYDPATGSVTGNSEEITARNGIAMEFQVNIKILSGRDRYRVRPCTYTIVGQNHTIDTDTDGKPEDIASALYGVIEAGSRFASDLAFMSKGIIVGFYAKLGKYRQDEMPINVPTGDNSYGVIVYDNQVAHEYGSQECNRNSELPVVPATTRISVPWMKDDVSRQDMINSIDNWQYADENTGFIFVPGQVKFADSQQTELVAYPCVNLRDAYVVQKSKPLGRLLTNNDIALGIKEDKVLSQLENTFTQGEDDTIVP